MSQRVFVRNLGGTPIVLDVAESSDGVTDGDKGDITVSGGGTVWTIDSDVIREQLTAARTYYVRTDGSNSNTGLVDSAGGAFLTIQKAWDVIVGSLDLAGFVVTVQIKDGTYTAGVAMSQPWTGGGTVILQGNSGTPANVLISVTGGTAFNVTCTLPGKVTIKDMKLTTTGGSGIANGGVGSIDVQNVNFGAIGSIGMQTSTPGAYINITVACTISGGMPAFCQAQGLSYINFIAITITLTGTPAFSSSFAISSDNSNIVFAGTAFSGSGTGARYSVSSGAIIQTFGGGATYLPGNAGGTGTNFGASPWGLYL